MRLFIHSLKIFRLRRPIFVVLVISTLIAFQFFFLFGADKGIAIITFTLVFFGFYINKRTLRRINAILKEIPPGWRTFLSHYSLYYPYLDKTKQRQFERNIKIFFAEVTVTLRGDFKRNTYMENRLYIAMIVATLLIGRPEWELPLPREIILMEGKKLNPLITNMNTSLATREALFLVEGHLVSPAEISKDDFNPLFYEIAHYFILDNPNNSLTGLLKWTGKNSSTSQTRQWLATLEEEYKRAKNNDSILLGFPFKNKQDFFAYATELFFQHPDRLKAKKYQLYTLISSFYNFDPLSYYHHTEETVTAG